MNKSKVIEAIEALKVRGAWRKGVQTYALELLEDCEGDITEKNLLNGADNWKQYSEGGCSLIYDRDIAERLCNKTELKLTRNGERDPNPRENWIQCQARALKQAWWMIEDAIEKLAKKKE